MIAMDIERSIKKIYYNKLRLHCGDYECTYAGGIITNYGPTKLYLLFKIINPVKRIGVTNLKYEIDRSTLANLEIM